MPSHGGPAEIVANAELCYETEAEAVAKIDATLKCPDRLGCLREGLAERANHFTTDAFMRRFRNIIMDFAHERGVART